MKLPIPLLITLAALGASVGAADEVPSTVARPAVDAAAVAAHSPTKSTAADEGSAPRIEGGQVNGRWREGSRLVNQLGYFKLSGEHVIFISSDGKLKFDGLENLAVERIARTIGDSPDQLEWSISGIITECRGSNYLLVTQAMLKTRTARPRRTQ